MAGPSRGRFEFRSRGQRRGSRALQGIGLIKGPAPEAHGGVSLEVAHHAPLVLDVVRHHAQRLADPLEQAQQVGGVLFRL